MDNTTNNFMLNVVYLVTDNGPIVVKAYTTEQDAWERYRGIAELIADGYVQNHIKGVAVDRVDVTDFVAIAISDRYFAEQAEQTEGAIA